MDYKLEVVLIPVSDVDCEYGSFADFSHPDGNTWVLQEVRRDGTGA
ncbi:MAG TPA: hypothetical protein VII47_01515 [Actinomycetota bacterium]